MCALARLTWPVPAVTLPVAGAVALPLVYVPGIAALVYFGVVLQLAVALGP